MTAELEGEHELGAHAVRAGDENRVLVFLADFEERAEAADGAEDARIIVRLAKGLMRSTSSSPASMETPAAA